MRDARWHSLAKQLSFQVRSQAERDAVIDHLHAATLAYLLHDALVIALHQSDLPVQDEVQVWVRGTLLDR